MSFLTIIDTILFRPLQLLFEIIYMVANRVIDNPGLSIVVLSLIMNFLVLPLYKRADAMQEEEREMEKRLHKGVSHIKKTFHGDERMMMLQPITDKTIISLPSCFAEQSHCFWRFLFLLQHTVFSLDCSY